MDTRVAIIDLGTNTFNLLVIEKTIKAYQTLYTTKSGVGLGFGGINDNIITEKALERALVTLREFKNKCIELEVDTIHAFGTSAIRNATNQKALLRAVKAELNITINVVTGNEEANLIYKGVAHGYNFSQRGLIMDIGGGSTELIIADKNGVVNVASFEMGVARIYQLREFSDPISEEDEKFIEDYLEQHVGDFLNDQKIKVLIGASGSFETCFEMVYDQPYPETQYVDFKLSEMMQSINELKNSTLAERNEHPRIIPIRRIMAPIAAVKINWIIKKLNIKKIVISPFAMKEGILLQVMDRH